MARDSGAIKVGVVIEIIITILVLVKMMPIEGAVGIGSIGLALIIYGVLSFTRWCRDTVHKDELVEDLMKYPGSRQVIIAAVGADSVTTNFAQELRNLFREARWDVSNQDIIPMDSSATGVILQTSERQLSDSLRVLRDYISQNGFKVIVQTNRKISKIQILFGAS